MRRVFIHSIGINNALGNNFNEVSGRLFDNKRPELKPYSSLFSGRKTYLGQVQCELPSLPKKYSHWDSRNTRLLLQALQQVDFEISKLKQMYASQRIGVVLATSTSGIHAAEEAAQNKHAHFNYQMQEIGNSSPFVSQFFDLRGPQYTVSTACSSSAKAMISGARLIQANVCDAVIAGGADSLCQLTLNGFDTLELTSSLPTNPFSKNRSGINIGEGAAVMILSTHPSKTEIVGWGESSDAYHISTPHPQGKGAEIAIRQALRQAQIQPEDIGYINLHGTGTLKNDEAEALLVHRLFGSSTPVSSTKPLIGHTLGASGAQEIGFCCGVLDPELNPKRLLPIHHWDRELDPKLPPLSFVTETETLQTSYVMSQSFAFGGSNAAMILRGCA